MTDFLFGAICGGLFVGFPAAIAIFALMRAMPRYPW